MVDGNRLAAWSVSLAGDRTGASLMDGKLIDSLTVLEVPETLRKVRRVGLGDLRVGLL
jgi:hypothetical protein